MIFLTDNISCNLCNVNCYFKLNKYEQILSPGSGIMLSKDSCVYFYILCQYHNMCCIVCYGVSCHLARNITGKCQWSVTRVLLELRRRCAPARGAGFPVTVSSPPARKVNRARRDKNTENQVFCNIRDSLVTINHYWPCYVQEVLD